MFDPIRATAWTLALALCVGLVGAQDAAAQAALTGAAKLRADALAIGGVQGESALAQSGLAMQFLDAARSVADIEPRKVYRERATRLWFAASEIEGFDAERKAGLREVVVDTDFYLGTLYGSPLAYVRPIEFVGRCGAKPAVEDFGGKRVLDFGHGGIGQLRMMAACGADVVGVDVDTLQAALYREPGDTGAVEGHAGGPDGRVTLVTGQWPAEEAAREKVGGGFDLIMSKNTLKRGYIHPEREADPRQLVHLGVTDEEFVAALYTALKPGGIVVIYNLSPAPSKPDETYKPWSDGRCAFASSVFTEAGFRVLAYDAEDSAAARDMGRALGWDAQGMDLQGDLFALVTIAWKPDDAK